MTAGYAADSDQSATVRYRAAVDSEPAEEQQVPPACGGGDDDSTDAARYPEPPAERQVEAWALVADRARDQARALAEGEVR